MLNLLHIAVFRSRGFYESVTERFCCFVLVAVGSLLALDTKRRPWHCGEAFWTDRPFALGTGSKAAVANAQQGGFHVAQQIELTVQVLNRQIECGRVLKLINLIRTLLDRDVVSLSRRLNQFGLFSDEDFFEFA